MHTLNGSGLGLAAHADCGDGELSEEDGSIMIPEVLRPYMGGASVIERK